MAKANKAIKCNKCGCFEVEKETVLKEYPFYCPDCHENLYSFEVSEVELGYTVYDLYIDDVIHFEEFKDLKEHVLDVYKRRGFGDEFELSDLRLATTLDELTPFFSVLGLRLEEKFEL